MTAQKFSDFAQNFEIFMSKLKMLTSFTVFSLYFAHIKGFFVIFWYFLLRKVSKTEVLTAHKNLLLECLSGELFKCIFENIKSFDLSALNLILHLRDHKCISFKSSLRSVVV